MVLDRLMRVGFASIDRESSWLIGEGKEVE